MKTITTTTTIRNTAYGPEGKPYACRITLPAGGTVEEWYWTEAEAWEARDRALDMGFSRVQVIGAPTRMFCQVHASDDPLDLPTD